MDKVETYWQDKSGDWRSSDEPHWRWRKKVALFLERKAKQEISKNERKMK